MPCNIHGEESLTLTGPAIPSSIDGVTVGWLREATGFDIESLDAEQIGVGIGVSSAVYRVRLHGAGCPESVVVKLPALDDAAVFTSTVLRMYIREAGFFNNLASDSPIKVPNCFHAAVDEATSQFVVVMEDMSGLRCVDQVLGMSVGDAEKSVDALAMWHARWWGQGEQLAASGLTISLGDPIYPAILPTVFAEGWEKVQAEMELPQAILDVGPKFSPRIESLLSELDHEPTTLAHGDFRADNMLFDEDGALVLLDFQLVGSGRGAYDLAYFVTQSLTADDASTHERALFDRWVDGLCSAGVPADDAAGAWEDYRRAALFCLVYPVVASRGMDLSDKRQYDLLDTMNSRFGRAVDELDLVSLL